AAKSTGSISVTVTAHNYLPYEATREILVEPADLEINTKNLTLSNSTPSEGDTLKISANVYNEGNKEAQYFYVECYDGDPDDNGIPIDEPKYIEFLAKSNSDLIEFEWDVTPGNHTLFVVVDPGDDILESDDTNNKASLTFYVNARPKLSVLPDFVLEEDYDGTKTIDLTEYSQDEDNNITDLQFTVDSITNPNCNAAITQTSILELSIDPDWFGLAVVTVEVSDGLARSSRSFEVKIIPTPDPPVLHLINDQDLEVGEQFGLIIEAEDPDGDVLTFSDNTKLFDIEPQSGRIAFKPSESDAGDYIVTITVTDGNLTDHQTINITISNGDDAKLISSIAIAISILIIILILFIYLRQSKLKAPEAEEPRADMPKPKRAKKAPPQKLKLHRSQKSKGKTLKKT
ncbi:MAG: hypothetical protein KAJ51_01700, partial [Thermoplasmata archaeon]|nr:hypothetical protein [Thermoplasmata archaeon]